ncbi:MAG: epoxyalkane--coenzyme M transferase [Streptosporangiales bacterium]|nr:epoxyalkane--coenzyme M transferase [Streptosporangiales bacterium]
MDRATTRILVSHAGALPAPAEFEQALLEAPTDTEGLNRRLPAAVTDVVSQQIESGVDIVNDGELSKRSDGGGGFTYYAMKRLGGLEYRDFSPEDSPARLRNITERDALDYPGFHAQVRTMRPVSMTKQLNRDAPPAVMCVGRLRYRGAEAVGIDIANLKSALSPHGAEGFLSAVAPGTVEHWLFNEYYSSDEEFLFVIADALHDEYRAITDAGLLLQIDDPDLADGWQMFPHMSISDYRKYAQLRVEALNHALRDCPRDLVRLHVCWGSGHGPHVNDVPLDDIVDIILQVKAACISIEASNPRHDHEWRTWESTRLPEGTSIMPGVAGHCTDVVEHPRLVADRLIRWAGLVGKENVIAGTDCGLGPRVAHPEIAWGKLRAMVEGARIASEELWDRGA